MERMISMTRPLIMTCALTLAVCAAPALSKKSEIVVAADSANVAVSRDLDRQLNAAAFRQNHGDGYAIVRFERGEDGRPANVTFYRRSGVLSVDRLARRAVSRLGARGGLPETGDANQPYQANIVLATSEPSYRKLAADLAKAERQRLASRPAETKVAVLGASRTTS
jgi:hypothetical protein